PRFALNFALSSLLGCAVSRMPPAFKMMEKLRQLHCIKNALRRDAALARHLDAPMHVIELADGMGVWIDAEYAAVIQSLLVPAPVKVETPGVRVDFDGDA